MQNYLRKALIASKKNKEVESLLRDFKKELQTLDTKVSDLIIKE